MSLVSLGMPLLHRMEAETAHRAALYALRLGLAGRDGAPDDPLLATMAFGLHFRNPVGLAAGFDKNAVAIDPLARLGFGFVEAGTVTPQPQRGNPRPRLFRLPEDGALVNRMGFNNSGLDAYTRGLRARSIRGVPVGASIGINKEGADPERDYPMLLAAVAPFADYVVINVSSPNTPGLRDLQARERLSAILDAMDAHAPYWPPLLLKIAPDVTPATLADIIETAVAHGVRGVIVGNTTVGRPGALRSAHAQEAGGLSGRPLLALSTTVLARAFLLAARRLTLVGVGGVASGHDALIKLKAGADLVQLYTAMVYEGPKIVGRIKRELAAALREEGFARLSDAVGIEAARLAKSA